MIDSIQSKVDNWRNVRVENLVYDLPRLVIYSIAIISLLTIVGIPIVFFLWGSVWSQPPGLGGTFTLEGYRQLFTSSVYTTFTNTLIVAVVGTLIAVSIGVGGLVISLKTNVWGGRAIGFILIIQYIIPSYLLAIGWELYIGPNGILNQLLMLLPFINSPVFNIYSIWGIALVTGTNFAGVVFLLSSGALSRGAATLEEAAVISGASYISVLRKISLRLILPSLVISSVIVFVRSASTFGAPLILGVPSGIYVVATHMFVALRNYPPNFALASAIGVVILMTSFIGLFLQQRLTGQRKQYATVTGKGSQSSLTFDLGRKQLYIGIGAFALLILLYLWPLLMIFIGSFQTTFTGIISGNSNWTLANYYRIFFGPQSKAFRTAFMNSMIIGFVGAFVAMILASLCSYIIVKTDSIYSQIVDVLTMAPASLPSIVVATAYLWLVLTYNDVLGLYGTLASLVVPLTAQFIVYGSRSANASFTTVDDSLEEAAQLAGASFVSILKKIYWPLIKPGFAAGYILLFVDFLKVVTIPIMMSTPDNQVLSTLIVELNIRDHPQAGVAVAVVMIVTILLIYAFVEFFTDIDALEI